MSKVVLGVRVSAYSFLVVILGVLGAFSFATLSAQELRKVKASPLALPGISLPSWTAP